MKQKFQKGDRVRSRVLGEGTVTAIEKHWITVRWDEPVSGPPGPYNHFTDSLSSSLTKITNKNQ